MTAPIKTYSVPEACQLLRVSRQTLNRWVRQGKVRKTRPGGGRTLFRESELVKLLDRGTGR